MAKDIYKVPESLNKNMGDMEISIKSQDGIGIKPVPIKTIGLYVLSILVWFLMVTKTFVAQAGFGIIILFTILWFILTVVLLKKDKTGAYQFNLVKTILTYYPKTLRVVLTRNSNEANKFSRVTGLMYDRETGVINFNDGSVGRIYHVVGNASILLFESDQNMILDRVDKFYRKMKEDYELIFITAKEPQKIYKQVLHMQHQMDNLEDKDPDLVALLNTEYSVLRNEIGGYYRSIHQYMVLKAKNDEARKVAENIILSEIENSSLMFKQCIPLSGDDGEDVFKTIYQGKESV